MRRGERPRIAIIGIRYLPSRGGTGRVVEDLILALKDRYHLTVYCHEAGAPGTRIEDVEVVTFPSLPLGSLGVFLFYLLCCVHVLLRGRYDLVHVHKTDAALFLPLISWRFPCVATSHEAPYRRDKWSRVAKAYFRVAERIFVRSKAQLTCISRPLTEYYGQQYGREVQFIPNGVRRDLERDQAGADGILAASGIPSGFVLFAARRIIATKGCHTLLEALRLLERSERVVVIGDLGQVPAYTRKLRALAEGLDVHFVGYVRRKQVLIAMIEKAELFVFPSLTEGMSIMLLEVASLGVPVVCSRIPENSAIFDESEVVYFEPGDALDLAEKLAWARSHAEDVKARAKRAQERVLRDHCSESIAERYAELYERILEGSISSRAWGDPAA